MKRTLTLLALVAVASAAFAQTNQTRTYNWTLDSNASRTFETDPDGVLPASTFSSVLRATINAYAFLTGNLKCDVVLNGYDTNPGSFTRTVDVTTNSILSVRFSGFSDLAFQGTTGDFGINASGNLSADHEYSVGSTFLAVPAGSVQVKPFDLNGAGTWSLQLKTTIKPKTNNPKGSYLNNADVTFSVI